MMEIHDHPRFPAFLRNLTTDALEAMWEFGNSYRAILSVLHNGLSDSGEVPNSVVDLCSGGGGPWLAVARQLKDEYGMTVSVCLTDRYPNLDAFARLRERAMSEGSQIDYSSLPVDAILVPDELRGFRTMFSSFHHFGPEQARAVLSNAAQAGQGIGVFEVAQRNVKTLLAVCFTPLLVLLLTPRIRPFRWSRLVWTYLLPVIPFVIGYDGVVSCLRTYSIEELRELVDVRDLIDGLEGYQWRIGEARTGFLPVTYLVGTPRGKDV